jgi:hypothetical protein
VGQNEHQRSVTAFCVTNANMAVLEAAVNTAAYHLPHLILESGKPLDESVQHALLELGFAAYSLKCLAKLDDGLCSSSADTLALLAYGSIDQETTPNTGATPALLEAQPERLLGMMDTKQIACAFCVSAIFLALRELGWIRPAFPRTTEL